MPLPFYLFFTEEKKLPVIFCTYKNSVPSSLSSLWITSQLQRLTREEKKERIIFSFISLSAHCGSDCVYLYVDAWLQFLAVILV